MSGDIIFSDLFLPREYLHLMICNTDISWVYIKIHCYNLNYDKNYFVLTVLYKTYQNKKTTSKFKNVLLERFLSKTFNLVI